jgi:hypothetical protein
MNIKEKDWKLLRKNLPYWQERYMEQVCRKYISVLSEDAPASERFWTLDKEMKKDKKNPGVLVTDLRRSTALFLIADLAKNKVITEDELHEFSDDTVSFVHKYLED